MSGFWHPEELGESAKPGPNDARAIARELDTSTMDTPHLFLGAMRLDDAATRAEFVREGIDLPKVIDGLCCANGSRTRTGPTSHSHA